MRTLYDAPRQPGVKAQQRGSWGHAVVPISAAQTENKNAREAATRARFGDRLAAIEWQCRVSKQCTARAAYWLRWRYITGRAGRASNAEKQACATHAERFAEIHGLALLGLTVP